MTIGSGVSVALALWLIAASVIDARRLILPDWLTLPLIPLGLTTSLLGPPALPERAIGAVCGYVAFAGIGWLYHQWRGRAGLGLGDAKLLAAAGAWVGPFGLPSVVLIAAVGGLLWALVTRPPADRPLPFGPFLAIGFWLVWMFGPLGV